MTKPLQVLFSKPLDPHLIKKVDHKLLDRLNRTTDTVNDKANAFKFGSDSFVLPLTGFDDFVVGKESILTQMEVLYKELKDSDKLVKLFLSQTRQFPLVAALWARKQIIGNNLFLLKRREYRYNITWRTKGKNYVALNWEQLFVLMKEMNLSHDEMLCHARINFIRLNLNHKTLLIDRKLKYLSSLVADFSEMDALLGDVIPKWLEIK